MSTWTASTIGGFPAPSITALAIDPTTPNVVWAGSIVPETGLYKSTNGGTAWVSQFGSPGPSHFAFDANTLYVSDTSPLGGGIVATADQGAHWSYLSVRQGWLPVKGLAVHNGVIFAGTAAGIDSFAYKIDTNATTRGGALMYGTYVGGSRDDFAVDCWSWIR